MIIDAHHHLWDPARARYDWLEDKALAPIRRVFTVEDLVVTPGLLEACTKAARAVPGLTFALDHLGKPAIRDGRRGFDDWSARITPLAACPNVVAKLSGMVTEADWQAWTTDDLRPF